MRRTLIAALLLAATVASAPDAVAADTTSAAVPGSHPRNDTVIVNRSFVRLGDLFVEAGDKADVAVAYAPAPGSRAVYDVNSLAALARANGIKWQARSWFDRVVVERPAITVGDVEIMAAVRAELAKRNLDPKTDVELTTRGLSLQLPADASTVLKVQNFNVDERTGQFNGRIVVPAAEGTQAVPISGRIYRTVDVPTLTRRIATGETIGRDDIQWQTARAETVARNVVLDPDKIVGKEAKHPLQADQPLRAGDVRAPVIVAKGSLVTLVVQSPTMTLTSKGKAMENGALGDSVRIQNTQSKIVVEGEVVSPGTVRVAGLQPAHF
jgi:flagellar basal body P-ring formation protein FlgA